MGATFHHGSERQRFLVLILNKFFFRVGFRIESVSVTSSRYCVPLIGQRPTEFMLHACSLEDVQGGQAILVLHKWKFTAGWVLPQVDKQLTALSFPPDPELKLNNIMMTDMRLTLVCVASLIGRHYILS